MSFFQVIVPNYNNAPWLEKCLGSVKSQTFTDYDLVFIDDCSTDNSMHIACEVLGDDGMKIGCGKKVWNGGARNMGLDCYGDSKYVLFLDSDDWFDGPNVLQELHDFIVEKNYPDCIRLPYKFEYDGDKKGCVPLNDDTPAKLVKSCFVACWTKCIKTDLIEPFPENTLMEDVVQHIKQCDVIKEVVPYTGYVVVHNRNNLNSCTRKENVDSNKKWQSSMFRYMADLLDLELEHDYCEEQRQIRASACLRNIKNDVYSQSIVK